MRRGATSFLIVGSLAVTGLIAMPRAASHSRRDSVAARHQPARTDLDTFTDEQLDRDLEDELDDVFEHLDPEAFVDAATLKKAIMAALSDDGDEGYETEITFKDLEDEMREAHTTMSAVVDGVLAQHAQDGINDGDTDHAAARGLHMLKPQVSSAVRGVRGDTKAKVRIED